MHALALHNVSHRFAGSWVLTHLTLAVAPGSRVLLTGDNGAGKTTLLRLMATALRPSVGEVRVFGTSATAAPAACRRRLALMTHQHYFYEALPAATNLQLCLQLRGLAPTGVAAALDQVGLARVGTAPVSSFSAGMVRRLALARLLLLKPDLVLLDEPFTALDVGGMAFVGQFLADLAARGTTWVLSTHDVPRARALCNDHVHLQHGAASRPAAEGDHAAS